jgi:hypothetical protein
MEVKLEYVVDLEEIPTEMRRLVPVYNNLLNSLDKLRDNLIVDDVIRAVDGIKQIKRQLYVINRRILDLEGIAQGYLNLTRKEEVGASDYHLEDCADEFDLEDTSSVVVVEE